MTARQQRQNTRNKPKDDILEKVIQVDRVARTVKGGRRIRFRALVVVGDQKGRVGSGLGKATEVSVAVSKATTFARRHMHEIKIINDTIPLEITKRYGSATVYLKPAPKGTSVIAGGSIRAVVEVAGIKNLVAKSLGSNNKLNNVQATILGLREVSYLADRIVKHPSIKI
ncbi:MAG TPA: 30S ribosomal protein S5 [Patescibacteria group bacterium]|nr:30S ribosomal protein S5 [Patescibacteria group bacterium]